MKRVLRQFVKVGHCVYGNCPGALICYFSHVFGWSWLILDPCVGPGPGEDVLKLRAEYSLLIRLPLGLLWVAGPALGLAQWADRSVTMNLLVAGQTRLERRRNIQSRQFFQAQVQALL